MPVTLNPFSPEARAIASLFSVMLLILGAIFVLVAALVTFAIVRYRDRLGAPEARQNFGNRNLEIAWTAAPVVLLMVVLVMTARTMRARGSR